MARSTEGRAKFGDFRLLFGLFGSAAAWFLHLNLVYILVPITCDMGGRTLLYIISGVLAAVIAAAGIVSWRGWRRLRQEERDLLIRNMEGSRVSFMLFGGVLASGLFLLGIALATIPILFVNPCVPTRGI